MDIGAWLRSLGLSRYEAAFSDNSIDDDVLADLTDGDLAQLGVNLGDRKRLLKAIASLGATNLISSEADDTCALIFVYGRRRASADDGHVLRPGRLDKPCGET